MTIDEIFEVWEHQPFSDLDDLKAAVTVIIEELEAEKEKLRGQVPKVVKPIERDNMDFIGEHYTCEACPDCGEELQKGYHGRGWQYCPSCGARLDWTEAQP